MTAAESIKDEEDLELTEDEDSISKKSSDKKLPLVSQKSISHLNKEKKEQDYINCLEN